MKTGNKKTTYIPQMYPNETKSMTDVSKNNLIASFSLFGPKSLHIMIWLVSAIPCAFMLFLLSCQILAEVPGMTLTVLSRVFVNCNVIFFVGPLALTFTPINKEDERGHAKNSLNFSCSLCLTIWPTCSFTSFCNIIF